MPAASASPRLRVQYVVDDFPQLSQTYIKTEIASVKRDHDVSVIGMKPADLEYRDHEPYVRSTDPDEIAERVKAFRPHVLHTHYLHDAPVVERTARRTGIPFTIRTHSFDTIPMVLDEAEGRSKRRKPLIDALRSDWCLGALAFPFVRPALERAGVPPEKIVDCWPVVDYARFLDRSPRGDDVMNVGACIKKKAMEDFVDLAARVPGRAFALYPIGYIADRLAAYNEKRGSPVRIADVVQPEDMAAEYRRHGWLVYTASFAMRTVGWPMAIAEAQAAGLGIVMARVRKDLEEYVGPAGFLYDSIDEVPAILERGYPPQMREAGFEHAKRSDIEGHRSLLTGLWAKAASEPPRTPQVEPPAPPARRGILSRLLGR